MDLIMLDGLSKLTAKVGDTFRAAVAAGIEIDDWPSLPEGTVVIGTVDLVKSARHGHLTGVIGVSFTGIRLSGAREQSIKGKLTSLR